MRDENPYSARWRPLRGHPSIERTTIGKTHPTLDIFRTIKVRYREDIVRYLYKRRQMANLEYFAGQFLEYHDEADVLPETEQPINLEELITDEITKQLGSNEFEQNVDAKIKDEL